MGKISLLLLKKCFCYYCPIFLLVLYLHLKVVFFLSCLGQTNTRLNKVKQVLELGNGGHRAEASVSAVPMFAFCLTP